MSLQLGTGAGVENVTGLRTLCMDNSILSEKGAKQRLNN